MTGIKIALSALAAVGGVSSTVTGFIFAKVPLAQVGGALSSDTPVQLTLALVAGGITATAVAAWKVSRAWAQMENRLAAIETDLASLKRGRAAQLREKLAKLEEGGPDA